ncbi:MAG: exodeoxyribonuclease VII small subunit [Rhodospirillaceae bacterium]
MPEQPAVPQDIAEMSFEQALAGLEAIVRRLDSGEVELDAAVDAFERGVQLKRHCEKKLAEARERVEQITQAPDGSLGLAPLPDME